MASYVCFDLETTGFSPKRADIVEIAAKAFNYDGEKCEHVSSFQTLVSPEGENHAAAVKIHGITDAMLRGKPRMEEVWPEFLRWIQTHARNDFVFVGHNIVKFDLPFLRAKTDNHLLCSSQNVFDTYLVAKDIYHTASNRKLTTLYKHVLKEGAKMQAHRAMGDVEMNVVLACAELDRLKLGGLEASNYYV